MAKVYCSTCANLSYLGSDVYDCSKAAKIVFDTWLSNVTAKMLPSQKNAANDCPDYAPSAAAAKVP